MKTLANLTITLLLTACGVDTASTAATSAAIKKQEIEQGKQTMEQIQKNMGAIDQQAAQRTEKAIEAEK